MAEEKRSKSKEKRPLWFKIIISFLAVLIVVVLAVGIYTISTYNHAKKTVNEEIHQKVTNIDQKIVKQKVSEEKSLNILLLGVDKRNGDSGRSDAVMVLTLDPKRDRMQLISIPRDTRTLIAGMGFEDKINHAYAYGGVDVSIETVEYLLDIEIDYYVEMNMEGLSDLIDVLGGITVHNELDWYDTGYYQKGFHYSKGELTLNGLQTMGYVRMRYQDPRGDFGRTQRQRQVIDAIIDKGSSIASVPKINGVIDVLGDNMATNLDFDDMKNLLSNYRQVINNRSDYMMQGGGKTIDGVYYYIVSEEEIDKVHHMIAEMHS